MKVPAALALQASVTMCLVEIEQHTAFTQQHHIAFMMLLEEVVDFAGHMNRNTEELLGQVLELFAESKVLAHSVAGAPNGSRTTMVVSPEQPVHELPEAGVAPGVADVTDAIPVGRTGDIPHASVSARETDGPDGKRPEAAISALQTNPDGDNGQLVQADSSPDGFDRLVSTAYAAEPIASAIHAAQIWFSVLAVHKLVTVHHIDLCEKAGSDVRKLVDAFRHLSVQAQAASNIAAGLLHIARLGRKCATLYQRVKLYARVSAMLSGIGRDAWQFTGPGYEAATINLKASFDLAEYVQPVLDAESSPLKASYHGGMVCDMWYPMFSTIGEFVPRMEHK